MRARADTVYHPVGTCVTSTNQLSIASNEVCVETLTESGKWINTGIPTNITGNEMPFPELERF